MRTLISSTLLLIAGLSPAIAVDIEFTFAPSGPDPVTSVSVRGTFNGWNETAMIRGDDGSWSVTIDLPPGDHAYKYFVNGQWPQDMAVALDDGPMDPGADGYVDDGYGGQNAVRSVGGAGGAGAGDTGATVAALIVAMEIAKLPAIPADALRIHYHRPDGAYSGWGLHVWEDANEQVEWGAPLPPLARTTYGVYWDIRLSEGATRIEIIVHRGDEKDPGPDLFHDPGTDREIWLISGSTSLHPDPPDLENLPTGDLSEAAAHWVSREFILWSVGAPPGSVFRLHAAPEGGLVLAPDGVTGGEILALGVVDQPFTDVERTRFPHLEGHLRLRLAPEDLDRVPELLRGQLAISVMDGDGRVRGATGIQIPGVLDDLFATSDPLGVVWEGTVPTVRVWGPTARSVKLHLFADPESPAVESLDMTRNEGSWEIRGSSSWKHRYYLYEVEVYAPSTGRVERNRVTDPYSRSLSRNSRRSQIVNLEDPDLMPGAWPELAKPVLASPNDITIYELHVRDFSASDPAVPPHLRGTFEAFTLDFDGTRHLRSLADAGLTHVHLMPAFDIATIDENRAGWKDPGDLSGYGPASEEQQRAVSAIRSEDGYNWGYDPFHYGVPEGSYAVDPDGTARILAFRQAVAALNEMGLRVVMDVVYNHTHASGQADQSVLDRIVPGYYHRLDERGRVATSTCCQNTATEHWMMQRLMIDDLVHWARDYKIDGFRFDLMGHHMVQNMLNAKESLQRLTVEEHGVYGPSIYLYGEGWDFGEVGGGARGRNATQLNLAGTGIGTFNDRLRDAARGGNPFGDRREQGFLTGLFLESSGFSTGGPPDRRALLESTDRIRVGLAGNLREFRFTSSAGSETSGFELQQTGYARRPDESVTYVAAHDNETLFDKIQYAAPAAWTLDDRVRAQMMGMSLVALSQGVPFFHAGMEMLRSKSMDADSYDSGDWFNRLDFSYESNNFGVGLPPAEKNRDRWSIIAPLLESEAGTPGSEEIGRASTHLREMLAIRKSSLLFRLRSAENVQARVHFHNVGRDQVPGLIVMSITDDGPGLDDLDPAYRRIIVLFNASPTERRFQHGLLRQFALELHPVQAASGDPVVREAGFDAEGGVLSVPGRTTAVFVERQ